MPCSVDNNGRQDTWPTQSRRRRLTTALLKALKRNILQRLGTSPYTIYATNSGQKDLCNSNIRLDALHTLMEALLWPLVYVGPMARAVLERRVECT